MARSAAMLNTKQPAVCRSNRPLNQILLEFLYKRHFMPENFAQSLYSEKYKVSFYDKFRSSEGISGAKFLPRRNTEAQSPRRRSNSSRHKDPICETTVSFWSV